MGSNALPLPFDVDYKYEWTRGCGYYCIEIFFFGRCLWMFTERNTDNRGTLSIKRFKYIES